MKKNRMMRAASALLVAVLMTTCTISGTFAKYVSSASANDSARVAKWGVTITAQSDEVFGEKYDDKIEAAGTKVVSTGGDVVAPGTNGDLGSINIGGTTEVMVDITATADLELTGWEIAGVGEYCPLVFQVGSDIFKIDGSTITTVADLETKVEEAFVNALAKNDVNANADLTDSIAMTWSWPFYAGEVTDRNDTKLGQQANAGAPAQISFSYSATVEQVD